MKKFAKTFSDDVELNFIPDNRYEFLLSTEEVALGYATTVDDIQKHQLNKEQFIKGKHWITQDLILWTKEGIQELGNFFKSQRAIKFKKWCEELTINSKVSDADKDILKYYELYGSLNPNAVFSIKYDEREVKAYYDEKLGFLISTPELAQILGIGRSAIRASKVYHENVLKKDRHFLKLGKNIWWTREGAIFLALRSRDDSFGRYLINKKFKGV